MSLQSLILLIEDEMPIRRVLRHALQDQGYATIEAATAADGLFQASMRAPNLILLDLGLPDIDGTEVTSILRRSQQVPIIVVSAREAEGDQIAALDAGANDYITKPFREGELLARVRAALRHGAQTGKPAQVFSNGRLSVDFTAHNVMLDGTRVDLTPKEYKLLALLVRQPGSVITHKNLLREIWGAAYVREVQYLRVFMRQLRAKLERDPSRPEMLLTAAGVGYRFRSDD
jgi:two-component system, OmpR family, KDP operon response regulator KdpE